MSSMRVLILTERFYPEDFGINDLALDLQSRGCHVSVLTQTPSYPFSRIFSGYKNSLFQKQIWRGIRIFRVWTLLGYKDSVFTKILNYLAFALLSSFVAIFIGWRYDRVFVYQVGPLTQALGGVFIKILYRKKIIIWTLDIWPDSVYAYGFKKSRKNEFLLNKFVSIIYKYYDHVLVSSRGFVDKLSQFCDSKRITYAPQWVPIGLFQDAIHPCSELNGKFNFTFAGNIGKVQNLEHVILGFQGIPKICENAQLNIIGDGSHLEHLKSLMITHDIKNVVFWGRKPLNEMPAWLTSSQVLIISLITDEISRVTIPAKFQTYLAAGRPIYSVMDGEVASLVKKYSIGYTADPSSLDDIKTTYLQFIHLSERELQSMAQNSKRLLDREFDNQNVLNKIFEIIK